MSTKTTFYFYFININANFNYFHAYYTQQNTESIKFLKDLQKNTQKLVFFHKYKYKFQLLICMHIIQKYVTTL